MTVAAGTPRLKPEASVPASCTVLQADGPPACTGQAEAKEPAGPQHLQGPWAVSDPQGTSSLGRSSQVQKGGVGSYRGIAPVGLRAVRTESY